MSMDKHQKEKSDLHSKLRNRQQSKVRNTEISFLSYPEVLRLVIAMVAFTLHIN